MLSIFYNKYTMPISRYSIMTEMQNTKLLAKSGIIRPSRSRYDAFYSDIKLLFNERDMLKAQSSYYIKVFLYNKIKLLEALYYGLLMTHDKKFIDYYNDTYGREPIKSDDMNIILSDIKKYNSRIKALNKQDEKNIDKKGDGFSFEKVIASVEVIMGYPIDRSLTLYQFKYIYDLAIKKAENG